LQTEDDKVRKVMIHTYLWLGCAIIVDLFSVTSQLKIKISVQ